MKLKFLKTLPLLAALMIAASCGNEDNDAVKPQPTPTENTSAQTTEETVTVPFTIKVNTGKSLTKDMPIDQSIFKIEDVGQKAMTVTSPSNGYSDVKGELSLISENGYYYFEGSISCNASNVDALTNGNIKLTGTYGTALEKPASSSKTFADLLSTCNRLFKSDEFDYKSEDITLTDQNAYLAITMSKCQHKLDVKSDESAAVECQLSDDGKVWVAVPLGAPLTVGSFLSKKSTEVAPSTIYTINRAGLVDLGITGILWADHNVGATNPWDYGDYYAWGETIPFYAEGHAYDDLCSNWATVDGRTITGYDWTTYSGFDGNTSGSDFTKYKDAASATLLPDDDVATTKAFDLGNCAMPTTEDFKALKENCYWVWTDKYEGQTFNNSDAAGYIIYKVKEGKGKNQVTYKTQQSWQDYVSLIADYDLSDTHIFIPAAGNRDGADFYGPGGFGLYWSSSLYTVDPYGAHGLYFYSGGGVYPQSGGYRYYGCPVRAVRRSSGL